MRQKFRQEEAEQILKKALARSPGNAGTAPGEVSQAQLEEMAAELGVDPAALEAATREVEAERSEEEERRLFVAKRRAEFWPHLISYLGVNALLIAINLLTGSDYFWAIWPILGWGLGLFFHAAAALPTRGAIFETEFENWRESRRAESLSDEPEKQ